MKSYSRQEAAEHLSISAQELSKNFPKVATRLLAKGIQLSREGRGENTQYYIEEVDPQQVDKSIFSRSKTTQTIELENENWVSCYGYSDYIVSDQGRIKNIKTGYIQNGTLTPTGYIDVSVGKHDKARLHRLILQSFCPRQDFEIMTVDHINGIRTDNRLENLRWATNEENVLYMIRNRADLTQELSRLIQLYGYEETLHKLQSL